MNTLSLMFLVSVIIAQKLRKRNSPQRNLPQTVLSSKQIEHVV